MGFIGNAVGSIVGGITGATASAKGAQQAANTQSAAVDRALVEQRAARDEARGLQQPYINAGSSALAQQMSLIGLNGTASQQDSLNSLLASPEYSTGVRQGEEAILQNAAATGGLRGGNAQNSLANFRSDLLNNMISQQYNRLGGIASLGQNAATGSGNNGFASAANIGNLLNQQGAAIAGGQIAAGNSIANGFNSALNLGSTVASVVKAF
jgi:hypothetical protein